MAALPLISCYVPKVYFVPWILWKLVYIPLLVAKKSKWQISAGWTRGPIWKQEIKMAGKHRKGNQYAEVGKHLGMNAKHPHLGSKPSVNTDGYFSSQQLNEAVPLGVSHVITHEHRVLRAQSFPDLAPFTAVQQSTPPAVIPHFYHFLLSSNVWSLLHSQTTGRERSCSYKCADLPS